MIWEAAAEAAGIVMVKSGADWFSPSGKTLIISSHGGHLGTMFAPAYPVVVQFATPDGGALIAGLKDAIDGKVTSSGISLGGKKKQDDYNLTHFERDPAPLEVEGYLAGKPFDVLMLKSGSKAFKLSEIIGILNAIDLKYAGILCVFCRVDVEKPLFKYTGKKSELAQQVNQHQVQATALAHELKAIQSNPLKKVNV